MPQAARAPMRLDERARKILIVCIRWAAAAIVFWIIFRRINFTDLSLVFKQIRWIWIVLALALEVARMESNKIS